MPFTKQADELLFGKTFSWSITGPDYNTKCKGRTWLFFDNRKCVELEFARIDYDGDFVGWHIVTKEPAFRASGDVHIKGGSYQDDIDEAMRKIEAAIEEFRTTHMANIKAGVT